MFSQRFTNPPILSLIGADEEYEIVTCSIVRVKEVGYEAEESKPAGKNEKPVLFAELVKSVLLELEWQRQAYWRVSSVSVDACLRHVEDKEEMRAKVICTDDKGFKNVEKSTRYWRAVT